MQEGATFTELTGYTEWVSITSPAISTGSDWMFQSSQTRAAYYAKVSKLRSNLMLVDPQKHDLGPDRTTTLIEKVVDEINWRVVVQDYISTRYASLPVNVDSCF
jgi:hypothetical protein